MDTGYSIELNYITAMQVHPIVYFSIVLPFFYLLTGSSYHVMNFTCVQFSVSNTYDLLEYVV